jgi:hypothetical protein
MIKTRITGVAALFTFGVAALGGIALAAPGNAAPGASGTSSGSSSTSAPAGETGKSEHMTPGLKSQQQTQDHLIPGSKLPPITTGSSNGPIVKLGSTDDSDAGPNIRIDQAWGACTLGC